MTLCWLSEQQKGEVTPPYRHSRDGRLMIAAPSDNDQWVEVTSYRNWCSFRYAAPYNVIYTLNSGILDGTRF